jgi:hypothetical protein
VNLEADLRRSTELIQAGVAAADKHHAPLREAARHAVAMWEAHPEALLPDTLQAALFALKAKL